VAQVVFHTTAENRQQLNVVFHKIIVRCVKNCASCRIPGLFAVRNECSFYSVQERKSRQLKLKLNLSHTPRRHLGERRCRSYSFSTSALDGGEWSASRPDRALAPEKGPPVPIVQEAGWAPQPAWTQRLQESFASAGDRTSIARSSRP
jgi:hypothetical protein